MPGSSSGPSRGLAATIAPNASMVLADGYGQRLRDDINASRSAITLSGGDFDGIGQDGEEDLAGCNASRSRRQR